MRDDDHWLDASLHEVLFYLSESRDIDVPESWKACIDEYIVHVRQSVSWSHLKQQACSLAGFIALLAIYTTNLGMCRSTCSLPATRTAQPVSSGLIMGLVASSRNSRYY